MQLASEPPGQLTLGYTCSQRYLERERCFAIVFQPVETVIPNGVLETQIELDDSENGIGNGAGGAESPGFVDHTIGTDASPVGRRCHTVPPQDVAGRLI